MKPDRIVIICIAIIVFIFALSRCSNCSNTQLTKGSDSTIYWKNKAGDVVASQRQTEEEFSRINKRLLDSIAKVYGTKPKQVKEYVLIYQESQSDVPALPETKAADYFPPVDSCPPQVKALRQTFANNYYNAQVQIGDSSYLKLQVKDTIAIVWHTVKTGNIFKRREYLQADVSNTNPDVKINGLQMYRVTEKAQKKIGIGIQGGYGFSNGFSPQPYIGIGISYNIIRL